MNNRSNRIGMVFYRNESSNVFEKTMGQRKLFHIDHIYKAALQYGLVYVVSEHLTELPNNRIGRICKAALQNEFGNELSEQMIDWLHNYIACICVTFPLLPHYVFLNVSSTRLHTQMQSHIDCICLTFLRYV